MIGVPIKRENLDTDTKRRHRKMAIYKPRKEVSEGANLADTLLLDFYPPEL